MAAYVLAIYAAATALVLFLTDRSLKRAVEDADRRRKIRRTVYPFFLLLQLLEPMGTYLPSCRAKYLLQGAGNVWFSFFGCYGTLILLLSTLTFLAGFLPKHSFLPGRRICAAVLCICLAVSVVLPVYAMYHAQQPVATHYDVTIEKGAASSASDRLRIVLIADLHLSCNSRPQLTQKMVDLVNEQDADVVLVAGDIFTSSYRALAHPETYAQILRGLQAKEGVYAVYGNHDCEEDLFIGFPVTPVSKAFRSPEMVQFFKDAGFTTLQDGMVTISDGSVQIIGREDGQKAGDGTADRASPQELLSQADPEKPVIVLEHEPVEYAALRAAGADLALSGHTHNGQVFPGNLIVRYFNENSYGYKLVGGLQTIVTAGVGYFGPPIRLGTNSEVTVVDVTFE